MNLLFKYFELSKWYTPGRSSFPFWVSCSVLGLGSSLVVYLKYGVWVGVFFSLMSLIYTSGLWGATVVVEGLAGYHSSTVMSGLKFSFGLFIFSEVAFFGGIFWALFDSALSPSIELGEEWSPLGVNPISPYGVPLFNTVVLLSSGATLTWAHQNILSKRAVLVPMGITLLLAFTFETAQYIEYSEATFSISDGIFGSVFYFSTGFHGLHVMLGHLFLGYNLLRLNWNHFSRFHHLSFEFAAIYWHFVDVVWLFLYTFLYWWSF